VLNADVGYKFITGTVTTVLAIVGLENMKLDPTGIKTLRKSLMEIPRITSGLNVLLPWLTGLYETVVNFVRINFLGYKDYYIVQSKLPLFDEWRKEVFEYYEQYRNASLPVGIDNKKIVDDLYVRGRSFMAERKFLDLEPQLKTMVPNTLKLVDEMKLRMSPADASGFGPRCEPLCILLVGKSGVGKSAMTMPFLAEIITRLGPPGTETSNVISNMNAYIYSRNVNQDFWDGYYQQFCCVYDDFLQAVDAPGTSSEALEIIKAVNMFPFALHSASLEEKGNSYFRSKVVLCSTNNANLNTNAIRENAALKRRFDLIVEVQPAVGYIKRHKDDGHAMIDTEITSRKKQGFLPEAVVMYVDNGSEDGSREACGFAELVQKACDVYHKKEIRHSMYLDDLEQHVKRAVIARMVPFDKMIQMEDVFVDANSEMAPSNREEHYEDLEGDEHELFIEAEVGAGKLPSEYLLEYKKKRALRRPKLSDASSSMRENFKKMSLVAKEELALRYSNEIEGPTDSPIHKVVEAVYDRLSSNDNNMHSCDVTTGTVINMTPKREALAALMGEYCLLLDRLSDVVGCYVFLNDKNINDHLEEFLLLAAEHAAEVSDTFESRAVSFTVVLRNNVLLNELMGNVMQCMEERGVPFKLPELQKTKWDTVVSDLSTCLTSVKCKMDNCSTFKKVGLCCLVLSSITMIAQLFSTPDVFSQNGETYSSERLDNKTIARHLANKKNAKFNTNRAPRIVLQSGANGDRNMYELGKKIHRHNVYQLILPNGEDMGKSVGNILFVHAAYFVMPSHFASKIDYMVSSGELHPHDNVHLLQGENTVGAPIENFRIHNLVYSEGNKDLCMGNLDGLIAPRPSIKNQFISSLYASKLRTESVCLWKRDDDIFNVTCVRGTARGCLETKVSADTVVEFKKIIQYPVKTNDGDCGSVITIANVSVKQKILGFHIAGDNRSVWTNCYRRKH